MLRLSVYYLVHKSVYFWVKMTQNDRAGQMLGYKGHYNDLENQATPIQDGLQLQ